jgi:fucose permease
VVESGAVTRELRRARISVSTYFTVMGMVAGVWLARIPAVKAQAHLSDGTLGAALFALPVGLVLGSLAAERLVDRVGSAPLVRIGGIGICVLVVALGLAHDLVELVAPMLVYGAFGGLLDVSQNAQGVRVEAAYGRPVMTSMHAAYSLGAMVGSLAGGAFAWAGVGPLPTLAVGGATGLAAVLAMSRWLLPGKGTAHAAQTTARGGAAVTRPVWQVVLALGVLAICGLVVEGSVGDWSAVYLRDNLGTSQGFAALAFAAFSVTMTIGRLVGDRLVRRFGPARLTRACGVISVIGLVAALAFSSPPLAIAGFTLLGAGLASSVPQIFAAGGRADPERPGSGLARVVGMGYAGMTAGPAVIGALATVIGLRLAFSITILLAALMAIAAPALGWRGERARPVPEMGPGHRAAKTGLRYVLWTIRRSWPGSAGSSTLSTSFGPSSPGASSPRNRSGRNCVPQKRRWISAGTCCGSAGPGASSARARTAPRRGPSPRSRGTSNRATRHPACLGRVGRGGRASEAGRHGVRVNSRESRAYREVRQGRHGRLRRR